MLFFSVSDWAMFITAKPCPQNERFKEKEEILLQ